MFMARIQNELTCSWLELKMNWDVHG